MSITSALPSMQQNRWTFFKTIEENLYTAAASYEASSILEKKGGDLFPYLLKLPSYIKEITVLDAGGGRLQRHPERGLSARPL